MLVAFCLRHVVGGRALKDERNIRLHVVNSRLRAAEAKLLLHGEYGIEIAVIAVFEQLERDRAAHAVVKRLRLHAVLAVTLPFGRKGNIVAGGHILERIGLVLRADIDEQLLMAKRMGKFLFGLQVDGL